MSTAFGSARSLPTLQRVLLGRARFLPRNGAAAVTMAERSGSLLGLPMLRGSDGLATTSSLGSADSGPCGVGPRARGRDGEAVWMMTGPLELCCGGLQASPMIEPTTKPPKNMRHDQPDMEREVRRRARKSCEPRVGRARRGLSCHVARLDFTHPIHGADENGKLLVYYKQPVPFLSEKPCARAPCRLARLSRHVADIPAAGRDSAAFVISTRLRSRPTSSSAECSGPTSGGKSRASA